MNALKSDGFTVLGSDLGSDSMPLDSLLHAWAVQAQPQHGNGGGGADSADSADSYRDGGLLDALRLPRPPRVALVMGNEARGASKLMRRLSDARFHLPMHTGGAPSAAAASTSDARPAPTEPAAVHQAVRAMVDGLTLAVPFRPPAGEQGRAANRKQVAEAQAEADGTTALTLVAPWLERPACGKMGAVGAKQTWTVLAQYGTGWGNRWT